MRIDQGARSRVTGLKAATAMLANDHPAQVLYPDLQGTPTRGAFLEVIRACCHYGISFYRTALPTSDGNARIVDDPARGFNDPPPGRRGMGVSLGPCFPHHRNPSSKRGPKAR
jgi:hypothetical protein